MNEQLKIIISAEINNLKKNVEEAKSKVSSFKDEVDKAKKNVDSNFQAAGESIKTGMRAGATAIAGAATALLALTASTEEYRNNQAKLATAFETAGGNAATAKDTYNDLYRVLGDGGKATEAAAHLAKLTTEEKALNEWTTICKGVYATFGDSLPVEALTEAANETAKVGTVTGTLADALNWAGISEDAFNEKLAACNTEAEREKLIRSTLNGLYNDAASKYEVNNAEVLKQNEAQAKLSSTMATVGEALAPVNTALTELANDILTALTPYITDFAENYLPTIKDVLGEVGDKLEDALNWIKEHKAILAVMAGIIAGIAAAIGIYNTVAAIKAAMDAAQVTTLGALIAVQAAQAVATMAALAPYLLIVAAIAAVIAIIVLCIKNWDKIKETVKNVATKIKGWVSDMAGNIKTKFNEIKSNITTKINSAKETVLNTFEKIKTGIKDKIEGAKNKVSDVIEKIKKLFDFKWSLPKLKMPHFKATGEFSLNPPSVPKISVDWYATGGVFDKPTLFPYGGSIGGLGEAGAEAVVPLEKNTQWLTRIADMLSSRMGSGQPIYLNVDGKVFAEIAVDSINDLTRLRGSIPLKLV